MLLYDVEAGISMVCSDRKNIVVADQIDPGICSHVQETGDDGGSTISRFVYGPRY
jgi:hypothetical protein